LGAVLATPADAFGDPSLILAYWLPERGYYVDAEGHQLQLRVASLDGRLEVDSPASRGTTVRAKSPCA
jgi:hypothetical protein